MPLIFYPFDNDSRVLKSYQAGSTGSIVEVLLNG
jgi:hypothetical protein